MLQLPSTEKSFWREAYPKAAPFPTLDQDLEVDVVIVGAGITGLTAAYLLKQSGHKVAVLEKRTVGSGTTGRTTGKVTSQHKTIYSEMAQKLGKETARIYADANQTAVETVDRIIRSNKLECDWQLEDNYVFTADTSKVLQLKEEARIAAELGLPASFELSTPLPFDVRGALKFTGQGKIHSQKYLLGLAKLVHGGGSFVFENSRVTKFQDGEPARVKANDRQVVAEDIIVATKVPSSPLIARAAYGLLEYPTESYAIACDVSKNIPGMYISPDNGHYSILPHTIDGRQILLIVGAGGNIPGVRLGKTKRYKKLATYAKRYFPVTAITNKWSDMDYLPHDRFPLVGRVYPTSKHLYTATGFMKWGLSNGTAAAMILHDLLLGKENKWAPAFESMRARPIARIPWAFFKHFQQ
jgi:glycine/D-amino acid oxidase-like deaminating enzyme